MQIFIFPFYFPFMFPLYSLDGLSYPLWRTQLWRKQSLSSSHILSDLIKETLLMTYLSQDTLLASTDGS